MYVALRRFAVRKPAFHSSRRVRGAADAQDLPVSIDSQDIAIGVRDNAKGLHRGSLVT